MKDLGDLIILGYTHLPPTVIRPETTKGPAKALCKNPISRGHGHGQGWSIPTLNADTFDSRHPAILTRRMLAAMSRVGHLKGEKLKSEG